MRNNISSWQALRRFVLSAACLLVPPAFLAGCHRSQPDIHKTGGTVLVVQMDPVPAKPGDTADMILTLMKRFARTKIPNASFKDLGEGKIEIDLPGAAGNTVKTARSIVTISGRLELKPVNLEGFRREPDGRTLAEHVLTRDAVVPGYETATHEYKNPDGQTVVETLLVSRKATLGTEDVSLAIPDGFDPSRVEVTLTSDGEDKMIAMTKDMASGRDRIAIILDGRLMSAPVIMSVPLGRRFIIEGFDGPEEARIVASALISPLHYRLRIVEEQTVKPESTPE